jgi:hypothetical protein
MRRYEHPFLGTKIYRYDLVEQPTFSHRLRESDQLVKHYYNWQKILRLIVRCSLRVDNMRSLPFDLP